jgi:ADP-ribosylglycohydrolase
MVGGTDLYFVRPPASEGLSGRAIGCEYSPDGAGATIEGCGQLDIATPTHTTRVGQAGSAFRIWAIYDGIEGPRSAWVKVSTETELTAPTLNQARMVNRSTDLYFVRPPASEGLSGRAIGCEYSPDGAGATIEGCGQLDIATPTHTTRVGQAGSAFRIWAIYDGIEGPRSAWVKVSTSP